MVSASAGQGFFFGGGGGGWVDYEPHKMRMFGFVQKEKYEKESDSF